MAKTAPYIICHYGTVKLCIWQ